MLRMPFPSRSAALAALGCCLVLGPAPGHAGPDAPEASAPWRPLAEAVAHAKSTGSPLLLLVGRTGEEASARLTSGLPGALGRIGVGVRPALAELPCDDRPEVLARLGVTTTPTALLYRHDGQRFVLLDHREGESDPDRLANWIAGRLASAAGRDTPRRDASLVRTAHHGEGPNPPTASAQSPPAPAQAPVQAPYPPQAMQPIGVPLLSGPPAPPVVVQPPPQTILLAPAPPPTVLYAPTAQAYAAPSPPQLFLAPAQAPPAPASAPAASAPGYVLVPVAPSYAPAAPAAIGQGPATTAFLALVAPTLIERFLGLLGEKLACLKNPRVVLPPGGTLAPLAPAYPAAMPAPYPYYSLPAAPAPAPVPSAQGQAPAAYPQAPRKGLGLFRR